MAKLEPARWWTIRRAQNRKPSTYRCPLCNGFLPALSEHVLIVPEGDSSRRRHAHTHCALAARKAGRLPTLSEWRRASGQERPGPLAALTAFMRRRSRADR
ncbi:MAG: hypothetical protein QOC95_1166 [Thermoleophilaceae bacterium]|nr:hypothetical protein [Thermoleophilaceae bacterium]